VGKERTFFRKFPETFFAVLKCARPGCEVLIQEEFKLTLSDGRWAPICDIVARFHRLQENHMPGSKYARSATIPQRTALCRDIAVRKREEFAAS